LVPERLVDALQGLGDSRGAVAPQVARPAVVRGVGGAGQVVRAAVDLVFAAGDGVVDEIVHEDLAAGGGVVGDVAGETLAVIETAPYRGYHLHDADRAAGRGDRRQLVAGAHELAPAGFLPRGGEHHVAKHVVQAAVEVGVACHLQRSVM